MRIATSLLSPKDEVVRCSLTIQLSIQLFRTPIEFTASLIEADKVRRSTWEFFTLLYRESFLCAWLPISSVGLKTCCILRLPACIHASSGSTLFLHTATFTRGWLSRHHQGMVIAWASSTPRSPVPEPLYLLALQLKSTLILFDVSIEIASLASR